MLSLVTMTVMNLMHNTVVQY